MRNTERAMFKEVPLIGAGFVVITVAAATAGAMAWGLRSLLHLARADRPTAAAHVPAW